MKRFILLFVTLLVSCISYANTTGHSLFQFERSKNRNYICYDVNTTNEIIDRKDPIHAYWIQAETDGKTNELSFFQKKMAFGYKIVNSGSNDITITLQAYDKLLIHVYKKDGKWVATTKMNGREIIITKMYAQLRSPKSLHVEYVDIYGKTLKGGEQVCERIKNS